MFFLTVVLDLCHNSQTNILANISRAPIEIDIYVGHISSHGTYEIKRAKNKMRLVYNGISALMNQKK